MFSGFQMIDGFRRNMFNNVPSKITDKKTIGAGYPACWLRADAGITKDENDYVNEWKDKDGRDYAFVQDTLANKPLWVANVNGQNGVLFDGSDDFLDLTKVFSFKDFFIVQKYNGVNTTYENYMCSVNKDDNTADGIITEVIKSSVNIYDGGSFGNNFYIDNKYQLDTSPIQDAHIIEGKSLSDINVSSFLRIGGRYNTPFYFKGYILEMLLFKEHLTVEQTNYWANYLATRYNITLQA